MRVLTLRRWMWLAAAASIWVTACPTNDASSAQATSPSVGHVTAASSGCDLNATTGNFASQVAAAQPGQMVCLASGSYGRFTGAAKPGPAPVTIEPAPGASVD